MKILVVDDEKTIVKGIKFNLENEGYQVDVCYDGETAVDMARRGEYAVILLDLMMPKLDGLGACQQIRQFSTVPIIMLTARSEDADKLIGFESGADDYITKPFSPSELTARVDAIYRRVCMSFIKDEQSPVIESGPFTLNLKSRTVTKNGKLIDLTQVEYQIMEYFLNNQNTALDRASILNHIWGDGYFGDDKIVDVNIRRIRMKIEEEPSKPQYITTIWGYGYKWNDK